MCVCVCVCVCVCGVRALQVKAANTLDIPVVITEQYPKGNYRPWLAADIQDLTLSSDHYYVCMWLSGFARG